MKAPDYRDRLSTGIVHFGPGAFHRAHQADFIHRVLEHDPRWGIAGVALRSADVVDAMRAQDGLYTLAIVDAEPDFRTIGAHSQLIGPGGHDAVRPLLADPGVRIVTSTVTEKGYCLAGDGTLDFDHPDVVHDLANPLSPRSLVGWLALGLADRRAAGLGALTVLSCDNLASNGRKLGAAVAAFAARRDADLARWIAGEARFPNTMVDSITPATTDALRARVAEATGLADRVPVAREAYAAWIIEDVLPAGGPDLAGAGAVLTHDVAGWEHAKLRLLNGPHSTLAYAGLLLGHETVADAMGDARLAGFVRAMMREEIAPTVAATAVDTDAYIEDVLGRFRNPVIGHKLSQIAWDGSQKLPYRLLATLAECRAAGAGFDRLAVAIASWMAFVITRARDGVEIVDPLASAFATAAAFDDASERLLALDAIFPATVASDPAVRGALVDATRSILSGDLPEKLPA